MLNFVNAFQPTHSLGESVPSASFFLFFCIYFCLLGSRFFPRFGLVGMMCAKNMCDSRSPAHNIITPGEYKA
jgi:hypothetical protein